MATPRDPRRKILFYAMYDARVPGSAPRVRIRMLADALGRQASVTLVSGSRWTRLAHGIRLLGTLRRFEGVYVETATSSAMPWDLWFLAAARTIGVPVGIYFRDAYPLHRDLYPLPGLRARLSDLGWRLSLAAYRRLASVSFSPSAGLADALRLRDAVLLPPGTEPGAPDLGPGSEPLVAYVGALATPVGFDRLLEAMRRVREAMREARLLAVGAPPAGSRPPPVPGWVEVVNATRHDLPILLAPAAVCVIPLPINRYTDFAWPLKLSDYLAYGKPIVATASAETAAALKGSEAGILVGDTPTDIADGLLRVLRDPVLAARMAAASRALAVTPGWSWDDRARLILGQLTGQRRTA